MNNNLLKGKRGIIFGALDDKSIAWKVAQHAHSEGAKFVNKCSNCIKNGYY